VHNSKPFMRAPGEQYCDLLELTLHLTGKNIHHLMELTPDEREHNPRGLGRSGEAALLFFEASSTHRQYIYIYIIYMITKNHPPFTLMRRQEELSRHSLMRRLEKLHFHPGFTLAGPGRTWPGLGASPGIGRNTIVILPWRWGWGLTLWI
jgi:hypothetical protein